MDTLMMPLAALRREKLHPKPLRGMQPLRTRNLKSLRDPIRSFPRATSTCSQRYGDVSFKAAKRTREQLKSPFLIPAW